jgi:hypothetical protein
MKTTTNRRVSRAPRANTVAGVYESTSGRLRQALHSDPVSSRALTSDDRLLDLAERRVRRRVWLRKTLPLNVILLVPGLLFSATRSKLVLAIFIATYPLVFVVRALLGRALSAWVGSEEILLRSELEKLRRDAVRRE